MGTSFILNQKKDELFKQVEQLMIKPYEDKDIMTELKEYDVEFRYYRRRMLSHLTDLIMVFILAFYDTSNLKILFITGVKQLDLITIMKVGMIVIMAYVYTITTILNKRKNLRKKEKLKRN